ncbi:hypothetical protein Hanom_Chr07g00663521 [Helianthus anomalus]
MWEEKNEDVNLSQPAHELTSRARQSSSSARLQTEPSRAGSLTTESISSRAFSSFFRVSFERAANHKFFEHP